MPEQSDWLVQGAKAVSAWKAGLDYGDLLHGQIGMCARLAREVWEHVWSRPFPYRKASANQMGAALLRAHHDHIRGVVSVISADDANAYHLSLAKGTLAPGAFIFFRGTEPYGHVAVVLKVEDGANVDLSKVLCVENTSSSERGPGTVLSTLKRICGRAGSDRVWMVSRVTPHG